MGRAAKTAEWYQSSLGSAEAAGDWVKTLEVLTEVRVLDIPLPDAALEVAARTLARGGQASRSADVVMQLVTTGAMPSGPTLHQVFVALAADRQAGKAEALLQLLSERGAPRAALTAGHNVVVRAVAQQDAARAYALLEALLAPGSRVAVQQGTFFAVCYALVKAGEPDKADEVLEWRDYLSDAGQEEEQG